MGDVLVGLEIPVGLLSRLDLVKPEAPTDPHLGTMGEGIQERMLPGVSWDPHLKTSPGIMQVLAKPHIRIEIRDVRVFEALSANG